VAGLAATAPPPAEAGAFPLLLSGGIDTASAFYFRGYEQADRGLILQPYLNFFTSHPLDGGIIVRPYVSLFHSAHEDSRNRMSDMSDVMLGAVTSFGGLAVDARYAWYTMNPLMRSDVHELGLKVSFDALAPPMASPDQDTFGLRPFAGIYAEVSDQNDSEDVYVNLGLEPTCRLSVLGQRLGLSLPIEAGLTTDRYYFDTEGGHETLGYWSGAFTGTLALRQRDGCGQWFLNTSLQYVHLVADSVRAASGGERDVWIGKVGLSFVF
jgi:hypothetical protein